MTFDMLSAFVRAFFALWALLLCLACIGNLVLSVARKRFHFIAFALLLFAPVYLLWQVIFDFSLFGKTEKASGITRTLCGMNVIWWILSLLALTAAAAFLFARSVRHDKNYITPGTIKLYLDKIPCGICCFLDSGRVLFSNICMNEICKCLTSFPLLNGNQFSDAVSDGIMTVEGKVWRFSRRDFILDGKNLHEIIASDITTEYAKTKALEKDKEDLSKLNRELREYYLNIDETVSRQEILQAKVNIHDEMNRLMLSTAAADINDTQELDRIFSLLEQNVLLLCMEAEETKTEKASVNIEKLAHALKINLIWQGTLPEELSEKQQILFFSACQEALANAVKHAEAKTMKISFEETEKYITCFFTNDGKIPDKAVKFTGGLSNLRVLAENQDADVSIKQGEEFTLILRFPKDA